MTRRRLLLLGSAGLSAAAIALVAFPPARHFLRHEFARHRFVRFDGAPVAAVVPKRAALPVANTDEGDPRFAARIAAEVAVAFTAPPRLDASAFAGPTVTTRAARTALQAEPIDKADPAPPPNPTDAAAVDLTGARQAIGSYRRGDYAAGDDFARLAGAPVQAALQWVAIRTNVRQAGLSRLETFAGAHPDWPTLPWVRRRIEEMRGAGRDPATVLALFATAAPSTLAGRLALARARLATQDPEIAATVVRAIWRDEDFTVAEEASILQDFGSLLRKEDHKRRADRLLYAEAVPAGLRAAALAGPDVVLLERARAAVIASAPSDAAIAAVPKPLQDDPGLFFARAQKARRAGRITEAAALLLAAPTDPDLAIDGDAWWVERRLVARKLLDAGDPTTAFRICTLPSSGSDATRVEAAFHAGWIALRFLHDPSLAAPRFATLAGFAGTPVSIARAAYWQGRTAAEAGDAAAATRFFAQAAEQPTTFYGQLAGDRVGRAGPVLREPVQPVSDADQREATRAVSLLFALGERDLALSLALAAVKEEPDPAQVASLSEAVAATRDAKAAVLVGKAAAERGIPVDEVAYPTFGIPGYQPLRNSADRSTVYAIARQESEFDARSLSPAGAKGLMQMITATARRTAAQTGVAFDEARLAGDPAFNAQLGAAHLGRLLSDQDGSYILAFAAYNAGPGKVKDWIAAYGDPRKPGVDPVDWIERIPFTETRNYVQRVFENMNIYRARFGVPGATLADLARGPGQSDKGT